MNIFKKHKGKLILAAALVTPGGFVALGLWKTYELYKTKTQEKKKTLAESIEEMKKEAEEEAIVVVLSRGENG